MAKPDSLSLALEHHRAGRLDLAEAAYRRLLDQYPHHAEALQLLGVVRHQRGDDAAAMELIGRAIELLPENATFHCNLAEARRGAGDLAAAVTSLETALHLRPDYFEARHNLGVIWFARGHWTEAEQHFRTALQIRSGDARAHSHLGDALREQGKFSEAIAAYGRALQIDRDYGPAHTNLGPLLLVTGEPLRALEHARRAVELQSGSLEAHLNLGKCLRDLGRFEEAMAAYEKALALNPKSAVLCNNLGEAWQEMNDLPEASRWYARALWIDPGMVRAKCNVASVFRDADAPEEASARYREILSQHPDCCDAHLGLAQALWDAGDVPEAVAAFRAAARARPELASIHASVGHLLASAGDLKQAVASHREALRRNRYCVAAWSGLAATLREKITGEEQQQIESLLGEPWLPPGAQAALHFGLAQVDDGRGDWDRAAAHMVRANVLQKQHWAERNQIYDPDAYRSFVDRLIDVFNPDFFHSVQGFGIATERPVFIVGMPRSGTTLTEQILATHPHCFGAGERRFAQTGFAQLPQWTGRNVAPVDCVPWLDRAAIGQAAAWHLDRLQALDGGGSARIVDKMPENYALLGYLAALFPGARFIHCRRDLRDVALSCWITNFAHLRWSVDLEHIAQRMQEYLRIMEHWRRVLPVPMLEIDYEKLVADQEEVSRRLVRWIRLEWDPICLEFHRSERLVRTASVSQVRKPIYRRSVARWQQYQTMLAPLLDRLAPGGTP